MCENPARLRVENVSTFVNVSLGSFPGRLILKSEPDSSAFHAGNLAARGHSKETCVQARRTRNNDPCSVKVFHVAMLNSFGILLYEIEYLQRVALSGGIICAPESAELLLIFHKHTLTYTREHGIFNYVY